MSLPAEPTGDQPWTGMGTLIDNRHLQALYSDETLDNALRRRAQAATAALIDELRPGPAPTCPGFEFATRYLPAEHGGAGGDWYDLFVGDVGQLWIIIGDVAGHGLGAAVVMGRAQATIRAYPSVEADPATVLERVDHTMHRFDPGVMVTAMCAVMPPPYRHMRIAAAGHPRRCWLCLGKLLSWWHYRWGRRSDSGPPQPGRLGRSSSRPERPPCSTPTG